MLLPTNKSSPRSKNSGPSSIGPEVLIGFCTEPSKQIRFEAHKLKACATYKLGSKPMNFVMALVQMVTGSPGFGKSEYKHNFVLLLGLELGISGF